MRVICRQCGSTMEYQGLGSPPSKVAAAAPKGAALEFACPCSAGIFLVVNQGEAMLVKSMGVKLGPEEAGPPFELAQMAFASPAPAPGNQGLPWSPSAWERAQKIPDSVRPMVIRAVASYAASNGFPEITESVLDGFKSSKGYMG